MVVGRTIEDRRGRHLVEKNSVIDKYAIGELARYGIRTVLVNTSSKGFNQNGPRLSDTAKWAVREYRRPEVNSVEIKDGVKKRITKGLEYILSDPCSQEAADTAKWITQDLLSAIFGNDAVAVNVNALKCRHEYTFDHSVDVAIISMVIAKEQNRDKTEIYEVGMAGLLHDIGKIRIPLEILNKPSKLTDEEFEVLKMHSYYSYQMFADKEEIPFGVKAGILQHHEKINGKGYPYGLSESQIHPYAKIIAVADIFDALITERSYKKDKSQREAIEMLMGMTDELDFDALQSLMKVIILYPVDSYVTLSNGETAKVLHQNKGMMLRPVVVGVESGNIYDLSTKECAGIVIV